jgi:hypothetical protein
MYSHKLELWYREAYAENGIYPKEINRAYAIFPKRMYSFMIQPKIFDFAFIGGLHIDPATFNNRRWILSFIQSYFGKESYLQFTDSITKNNYISMGEFDHTLFTPFHISNADP